MKNKFNFFLLLIGSILLTGCDPSQSILFKNNTDSIAKVKFKIDPNIQSQSLQEIITGDSIVLNLQPTKKQDSNGEISFGIGVWDDSEIDDFVKSTKSIEIETKDIITIYKSKESIKKILKDNLKGIINKSSIEIEIN